MAQAIHLVRRVKIYPIQQAELTSLSLFSTIVSVSASIASLSASFLLTTWWSASISQDQTTKQVGHGAEAICWAVIVGCVGIGGWAIKSRQGQLAEIISESRIIDGPSAK